MNPADVLRKSRDFAEVVLRESLAELTYETKNGFDRDRIQRFTGLAAAANELLEGAVKGPPTSVGTKERKAMKAARKKDPPKVKSTLTWATCRCPCGKEVKGPSMLIHTRRCPDAIAQKFVPKIHRN